MIRATNRSEEGLVRDFFFFVNSGRESATGTTPENTIPPKTGARGGKTAVAVAVAVAVVVVVVVRLYSRRTTIEYVGRETYYYLVRREASEVLVR